MIARTWRCRTDTERADALAAHLRRTGIADARVTDGYCGHVLTRRGDPHAEVEFTLVTFWSDMAAIERFAGDDLEAARLYPSDERFAVAVDEHVVHAEVVEQLTCPAAP